ncbi:hypothetical protein E2P81_ATG11908 [Venturia nashicola]|uniref:Uncharacterized protein n=1 Tax=Venturia nashicola TaxID=86259 RepID=A0A4Z1NZ29_9PEZI|nr:hypothetical protein E6O75_ATG11602 [Venturia nashicola]TLD24572.1 hypothetical protein E2P81_ATG11908 [Venturia nashicola]
MPRSKFSFFCTACKFQYVTATNKEVKEKEREHQASCHGAWTVYHCQDEGFLPILRILASWRGKTATMGITSSSEVLERWTA